MTSTLRLDQIRRLLASESSSLQALSLATDQLCDRTSHAAAQLRQEVMNRLSSDLRIDSHPLLRKGRADLRPQDIPQNNHLHALRRVILLVLEEVDAAQKKSNTSIQPLLSSISIQEAQIKGLRAELDAYVESLTEDRSQNSWSSSTTLSTARRQFISQVSNMARDGWPKRSKLESASRELENLKRQLAIAVNAPLMPGIEPVQLRKRLRNIDRVLVAAKQARQDIREQREANRQLKAQEVAEAARIAALRKEEDKRRKAAIDKLQADLDDENTLIKETAQRLASRENLVDVIKDLKRRGVLEPLRIAQQATIYARNVLGISVLPAH